MPESSFGIKEQILTKTLIGIILLTAAFFFAQKASTVSASNFTSQDAIPQSHNNLQPIKTESRFTTKQVIQTETIPYKTTYKDDPNTEAGNETVLTEGKDEQKVTTIQITYYQGHELGRDTIDTQITPVQNKVVLRGTKIVWHDFASQDGNIHYWKKLHVYATQYDPHCLGCDGWTAIGLKAGKGVIAVDPSVIKLGSRVYVAGYGFAIAGDTGGAIKGNRIDVGFDNAKTSGWYSHYTDIYILN